MNLKNISFDEEKIILDIENKKKVNLFVGNEYKKIKLDSLNIDDGFLLPSNTLEEFIGEKITIELKNKDGYTPIDISYKKNKRLYLDNVILDYNGKLGHFNVGDLKKLNKYINLIDVEDCNDTIIIRYEVDLPTRYSSASLHLIHRSNKVTIDGTFISNEFNFEKQLYEYSVSKSDFLIKGGVWDFFVRVKSPSKEQLVRVDCKKNIVDNKYRKTFFDHKRLAYKIYSTLDSQLSCHVTEVTHKVIKLNYIRYNSDSLEISGSIIDRAFLKKLNLNLIYNENKIEVEGNIDLNAKEVVFFIKYRTIEEAILSGISEIKVFLSLNVDGNEILLPFKHHVSDEYNASDVLVYPHYMLGDFIGFKPNFNKKNELSFVRHYSIDARVKKIKYGKKIEIVLEDGYSKNIKLVACSTNNKITFQEKNGRFISNEKISNSFLGKSKYYLKAHVDGRYFNIHDISKEVKYKYKKFSNNKKYLAKKYYISCLATNSVLCFEIRKLRHDERLIKKAKLFVANTLAAVIKPYLKKPVLLVGENLGLVAQDNGYSFYEYAKNDKRAHTFYTLRKSSPDKKKTRNTINYDSFLHYLLYCLSDRLVVAHGIRDVVPTVKHTVLNRNDKKMIYLQHGVMAMKRVPIYGTSYNNSIDKFVVSSDHEKQLMVRENDFSNEQIIVTGLARFDKLFSSKNETAKEILVMPTWRDWLVKDERSFLESDFYKKYSELLSDEILLSEISRLGYRIRFLPHIEMYRRYLHCFSSSSSAVEIINPKEDSIQNLIKRSSAMITDYSSVAWDFLFLGKPIIFYHFDSIDYLSRRGSYITFSDSLPGDICYNHIDLTKSILKCLENSCQFDDKYQVKLNKFLNTKDSNNSKRIFDSVVKAL